MKIYNIFSKKKIKEKKIKIEVDNREKGSLVASELANLGIEIEFKQLPVGDYIVNGVAIERKTISDFKTSIINKRIISQLLEIKQFPQQIFILEGISEENLYEGIIHENAFRGFLLSVALEYRVPIIFTQNSKDTAKYLSVLAKKTDKKDYSIRPGKILFSKEEQLQFILEGFPYIGPITAKKLLKKFGSIKNIINASESELTEILGKRASDFKKLID